MAFAASSDLFTMTISNRIAILLVLGFLALALPAGLSPSEIAQHFGAAAAVLAVTFFFFSRGWVGGGDAKLAAASALWIGWGHLYEYLLYASLLGGALTLLLIQFRSLSLPGRLGGCEWAERLHQPNGGIPYGIALAAAALLVYPSTVWMAAAP
jgi:prepilin peptidase CpaA